MKISKLFHWLYALVMLLPIFAIGVTCGYAMFNKNAYQSYYGNDINDSEKIIPNGIDLNETYYLETSRIDIDGTQYIYVSDVVLVNAGNLSQGNITLFYTYSIDRISIYLNNSNVPYMSLRYLDSDNVIQNVYISLAANSFEISFNIVDIDNFDFSQLYYIQYDKMSFLSESFYYAVDRVKESPLFNWAYDSFLVVPFAYIVNLFSMPTNSFVVMLLSYWLAISIIWLVFDLVMYIPLLVHRWLDKGVLE